ncbi:hypothetical protein GWI33_018219 [Rhynchophorus ferrugineus]|uniref:Uncharacterized protein n=1 Tax=Rhynchophorus ferrugineus TaxID=354439 RepID=A0A834M2T7_RHYFE|nr:hypothetical protein GWI33_018219 [Rhynchophorus ferrugineus]
MWQISARMGEKEGERWPRSKTIDSIGADPAPLPAPNSGISNQRQTTDPGDGVYRSGGLITRLLERRRHLHTLRCSNSIENTELLF